jgi:hypothetical protein
METISNTTKIKNSVAFFLEMEKINYNINEDTDNRSLVQFYANVNENTVNFYIDYQIERKLIVFAGLTTQSIPLDRTEEVQILLNYINYEYVFLYNFIINPENGILQSRSTLITNGLEDVNMLTMQRHVYEILNGIKYLLHDVMRIGYGDIPASQIIEEMKKNNDDEQML